jgi:methylated-DNA-[protein]-cysteine S-methyltransferase
MAVAIKIKAAETLFTTFDSPVGPITLVGDRAALHGLFLRNHRHWAGLDARATRCDEEFAEARQQLEEYFAGTRTEFDLPLELHGTEFQRRVWEQLRLIPAGETISYAELARRIGNPNAMRAVGLANGRNPISIIVPCHRVIATNGKLTGYGGGIENKAWLLDWEQQMTGKKLCI